MHRQRCGELFADFLADSCWHLSLAATGGTMVQITLQQTLEGSATSSELTQRHTNKQHTSQVLDVSLIIYLISQNKDSILLARSSAASFFVSSCLRWLLCLQLVFGVSAVDACLVSARFVPVPRLPRGRLFWNGGARF